MPRLNLVSGQINAGSVTALPHALGGHGGDILGSLGSLLGDNRPKVENAVAQSIGLDSSGVTALSAMLAP